MESTTITDAVEWGGSSWSDQVRRGLDWLGDPAGLSVLEIGTRFGGMAVRLAELGARVTAMDVDPEPLAIARKRAEGAGVASRVDFGTYSGDAADLPTGFDVVFSKSTLVLMAPLDRTFAALRSCLVPGGRLLAVENARGPWPIHLARMLRRRSVRPHGAEYFTPRTIELAARHLDPGLIRWTTWPPTVLLCATRRPTQDETVVPLTPGDRSPQASRP